MGAVKIEKTCLKSDDVLVARLSGAVQAQVAVVKHKKDYYFVPPEGVKAFRKVPADNLTDGLHASILEMNLVEGEKKLAGRKKK